MRAVWIPEIKDSLEYVINGETHHHLVNVVRIQVNEELLLLDGRGLRVRTRVKSFSKKESILEGLNSEMTERGMQIDLALGIPKREALELSLKQATELGFRRIYLVRSAYSQLKVPELERLKKILVSSLEQSNASFIPEIIENSWSDIPWGDYGLKLMMDSQTRDSVKVVADMERPALLIVGPEGGFDSAELGYLHKRPGLEILNLPTSILRTPTAVAAGAGCLLQRLIDRR